MDDELGFINAAAETFKRIGLPPLIGTFKPVIGDVGLDKDGNYWVWDDRQWIDTRGNIFKTP